MCVDALLVPMEMFIQTLDLQRFRVLYMTGNYSAIRSCLDRRFETLEIDTICGYGQP